MGFGANVYMPEGGGLRTTDHVEKLMPDIDMEDMLSMSIYESVMGI